MIGFFRGTTSPPSGTAEPLGSRWEYSGHGSNTVGQGPVMHLWSNRTTHQDNYGVKIGKEGIRVGKYETGATDKSGL